MRGVRVGGQVRLGVQRLDRLAADSVVNGASRSGEASKRSRSQRSTMDSSRSSRMGVAMGTV